MKTTYLIFKTINGVPTGSPVFSYTDKAQALLKAEERTLLAEGPEVQYVVKEEPYYEFGLGEPR
jgi:hypothetical protein